MGLYLTVKHHNSSPLAVKQHNGMYCWTLLKDLDSILAQMYSRLTLKYEHVMLNQVCYGSYAEMNLEMKSLSCAPQTCLH